MKRVLIVIGMLFGIFGYSQKSNQKIYKKPVKKSLKKTVPTTSNKVETAVRLKHIPSGIVVECQQSRTQGENREKAIKMLKSRLYEVEIQKREELKNANNATKKKIEWGSQIRSYVFHPYKMIKDHRTNFEINNIGPVMDGEIDGFIKAFLMQSKEMI